MTSEITPGYHIVLYHGYIGKAHYPSSYSNWAWLAFLQLHSSSEAYPTRLEKLLKYQLGVWERFTANYI